ncbi:hypothetical protein DN412_33250 [Cupriavidus lacunae]|uniref:Uncharacterized protein n=2 Tax=Cupriavidus lacunae TaxID=2666307 RepID=A0A370NKJ0_9BURK|nr:hypothetical protein DN412_33250 [Cupriavidus lacunae]
MIDAAALVDDLNEALYPLQRAAGIDAGDVAGVFFSGNDKNESTWATASPAVREQWLQEYLDLERWTAGADDEDDDAGA